MKVTTVTATIRYSQDSGKGAWKSLELGAEAQVAPNEDWADVQVRLYDHLAQQFKQIWSKNGNGTHDAPPAPEIPAPPREHWCVQHNQEWKKFTKGNQVWWSHRAPDGTWCKEN
jgi:hypothetical protein